MDSKQITTKHGATFGADLLIYKQGCAHSQALAVNLLDNDHMMKVADLAAVVRIAANANKEVVLIDNRDPEPGLEKKTNNISLKFIKL